MRFERNVKLYTARRDLARTARRQERGRTMFDIRIGKTAATLKASTRRAVATMFFLLLTSLGGTSAALAACQTSADFTGAVLNSVVSLDVSTCAANIRAGLYTTNGLDSNNAFPLAVDPVTNHDGNPLAITPKSITLGTATVLVTPVSTDGTTTFSSYNFKLTALATTSSGSVGLFYASASDPLNGVYGVTNTAYNISVVNIPVVPTVTVNPVGQIVTAGQTATFTATATGASSVQWQVSTNGGGSFANVAGATSTSLSFTATVGQNGNQYQAVFNSAVGSATTSAATLTVNPAVTATQSLITKQLTQNKSTPFTPVTGVGGTGGLTYSISPALPAGLSITPSTGVVGGTPTATSPATIYTVTVKDTLNASASNTFTLTVNATLTSVQVVASEAYTQNTPLGVGTAPVGSNGGTSPVAYAVTPALPTGLSMSTSNGQISGTPTVTSPLATYTVNMTDANGATASNTFTLIVNPPPTATQAAPSTSLTVNVVAASFTPVTGGGGTTPLSYAVSPALPTGLSMASTTGAITGTPTATSSATTYTVTVKDANNATATNTFSLAVISTPNLAVALTPNGAALAPGWQQGSTQTNGLTITPSNASGASTSGTMTLAMPIPTGFTIQSVVSGADWNCTASTASNLSCTTSTVKAAGQAWSNVGVNLAVASTATPGVGNAANTFAVTLSGGGAVASATASSTPTIVQVPTQMSVNSGTTPQSATVLTAFANALAVTVKDAGNNPVQNASVTFTAPASGASGTFTGGTNTITVATTASGVALAPFTANAIAGSPYQVSAAAAGLTTVNFSLTNTAGPATQMSLNPGTTPQSAQVSTAFAVPPGVIVKDVNNNPVSGVTVTFTAPASGASGTFSNATTSITVVSNSSGVASAGAFTANPTAGGPYNVAASASGVSTVNFALTNVAAPTITLVAPAKGTTSGGTFVSISGTGFAGSTGATIGGVALSSFTLVNATTITGYTGAHPAPGAVDVVVTVPLGTGTGTGLFTYAAPGNLRAYSVVMNGPSESPVNASPGVGVGSVVIDMVKQTMSLTTTFSGLGSTTTASHIHATTPLPGVGTAGVATTTPSFPGFPLGVTSGSYTQTFDMTLAASYNPAFVTASGGTAAGAFAALTAAIDGGEAYWNIHTSSFPGGEICGFLVPAPAPVVTSSAATLAANATGITIAGTGFDGVTPANNTVTFNDGATGTVTAATPTSLTVTFATKPAEAGSLTAIVSNGGGSSGSPVQVATVIPVITSSAANILSTDTGLAINGFGFSATPANNVITLSSGSGTIASATNTQLTLSSVSGLAPGALGARVASNGQSNGAAVQIANVLGVATHFQLAASSPQTAGGAFNVAATALDALNQTATGYLGTVHFSSSDIASALPADYTFGAGDNGVHTFSATLRAAGTQTITATDTVTSTITGATGAIVVSPAAPASLAFVQQPSNGVSAAALSPAPSVRILDAFGNPTSSTASVTLTIGNNPSSGLLSGAATVNAVAGVATFTGLSIDKAGTGYALAATSGVLTGATSTAFNITAGAASAMTANLGTTPQSTVISTGFGGALAVTVTDAAGNPVAAVNVTFTAPNAGASGTFGNSAATITVATNASGVASAAFTANATAGTYSVAAAAPGASAVSFALTNLKRSQSITFTSTPPRNAEGGGATYTPVATSTSGLTVAFTIDATATSVCSISGGVVSFIATGTCVIDANQAGNGTYNAAPQVQQSVTVNAPPTRTWVSRNGNDANLCTMSSPCLTFQAAHDLTSPKGEVNCLDSADYGQLTITKSIIFKCSGVVASIAVGSGSGITVSAGPTDKVVLDGLDIDGLSTGSVGISVNGGSKVYVINTTIRSFGLQGIQIAATNTHFFLDNSFVIGNPTGVFVSGTNNIASLTNSSVHASPITSLNAAAASAIVGLENCILNDSPVDITRVAGAQVISVGPSNLVWGPGTFTSIIPYE
jgi:hypothetical protein